jgi:hypothetical protein
MIANRRTREPLSFRRGALVVLAIRRRRTPPWSRVLHSLLRGSHEIIAARTVGLYAALVTVAVAQDGLTAQAFRLNERCG